MDELLYVTNMIRCKIWIPQRVNLLLNHSILAQSLMLNYWLISLIVQWTEKKCKIGDGNLKKMFILIFLVLSKI